MVLAASDYPLLNLFWTTFIIFGWILWFFLLIRVFSDLFSRRDIGGGLKAVWVVLVLVIPLVGALIYLISQGHGMQDRALKAAEGQRAATDAYVRSVVAESASTQKAKAEDLLQSGAVTSAEYDRMVGNAHP